MEEPASEASSLSGMSMDGGQTCGTSSYNYGMGRFFQRPPAFDCMQGTAPGPSVGMGAAPYSYPPYHGDWGFMHGHYSQFNLNRPLGLNNLGSNTSGFLNNLNSFSVQNNISSRDYGSTFSGIGSSNSAFSSTGINSGSHGTSGGSLGSNMCGPDNFRVPCASPDSRSDSSGGSGSPCLPSMDPGDKLDPKGKGNRQNWVVIIIIYIVYIHIYICTRSKRADFQICFRWPDLIQH